MKTPFNMLRGIFLFSFLLLAGLMISPVWASHTGSDDHDSQPKKRPFFEYKGDYRGEINSLKEKFQEAYGYQLMDLDRGWIPDEIKKLHDAFAMLPESFYRLPGLKGFYRSNSLNQENQPLVAGEIFAATFPKVTMVYRQDAKMHLVQIQDETPRIEFYNDLFYLDPEDFQNIVQHEMGHIFDVFNDFPSLQAEWLTLAGFSILNLPALDGERDSDFLYTLINDPDITRFSPVSNLQQPIHSRENPMEDFANAVAGYIHYPYFRYTNPERYRFMKERVFKGKEYFEEARPGTYAEIIHADFQKAIDAEDWGSALEILKEAARTIDMDADEKMFQALKQAAEKPRPREDDHKLAAASCYLLHPGALLLRQELWSKGRIDPETILKMPRCGGMQKRVYQERLTKVPVMSLYFFQEKGESWIQFLDPTLFVAQSRGFKTSYKWRLSLARGDSFRLAASGQTDYMTDVDGSIRISLEKTTLRGADWKFPPERMARLEVWAERKHPLFPKVFASERNTVPVVAKPWFDYLGPKPPKIHIVYPPVLGRDVDSVR
ncbi:hypothetical protein [Nitrospina watsonii]|uniref:Uncharacterized protein n=1 Tax=Nitrospina watsonii TaxID=1323948 RepID=A0ABM9HD47_9BACT|nr:hypothetical protein [Nitrospina watsonii]CAI2718014.1 conserved exported protein of unknown function [Nitrospina watsonii]